MNDQIVLQAISDLTERMDSRFDRVDDKFDAFDERMRKAESDITTIKTVHGVTATLLAFVGWSQVKPWLMSLMK